MFKFRSPIFIVDPPKKVPPTWDLGFGLFGLGLVVCGLLLWNVWVTLLVFLMVLATNASVLAMYYCWDEI